MPARFLDRPAAYASTMLVRIASILPGVLQGVRRKVATKPKGAPNVVILRLAKRAEGSLKCNACFLAGVDATCRCEVPRPAAAGLGMTRLSACVQELTHRKRRYVVFTWGKT